MAVNLVEDLNLSKDMILKINDYVKNSLKIMEVCGTHTMSIYKYGIDKVMPNNIQLISGPGCPVCVTEINYIDNAISLLDKGVVIATFADMLKVPGSYSSLIKEKSKGKKIEVIYSPEELLTLAENNKKEEIVFMAVGFETIAPIYADVLIDEVCNIIKPISDKKHITITKNILGEILFKGDFIKLQQVLFNILGNAVKFSPENSEIKISAKTQGDKVVIKIKDEGIGIAKKYHKKIFDKFFQVENSMSKTEASTGLGLAISKEFVKMHGGEISVDSSKGNGTEFTITLKSDYQG